MFAYCTMAITRAITIAIEKPRIVNGMVTLIPAIRIFPKASCNMPMIRSSIYFTFAPFAPPNEAESKILVSNEKVMPASVL